MTVPNELSEGGTGRVARKISSPRRPADRRAHDARGLREHRHPHGAERVDLAPLAAPRVARRIGIASAMTISPSTSSRRGSVTAGVNVGRPVEVQQLVDEEPGGDAEHRRDDGQDPGAGAFHAACSLRRAEGGVDTTDAGQHGVRIDGEPRPEHEVALGGARCGSSRAGSSLTTIAVGDEVEVEGAILPAGLARRARRGAHPAVPLLDRVQVPQQHRRCQARWYDRHGVQVRRARRHPARPASARPDSIGSDTRTSSTSGRRARSLDGRRHRLGAVAQIRAERHDRLDGPG